MCYNPIVLRPPTCHSKSTEAQGLTKPLTQSDVVEYHRPPSPPVLPLPRKVGEADAGTFDTVKPESQVRGMSFKSGRQHQRAPETRMGRNTKGLASHGLAASPRVFTFPPVFRHSGSLIKACCPKGYLPLASPSRTATLARKRAEYHSMVETTFARGREGLDQQIWHQIEIDVPRTRPGVRLWMLDATQRVCHSVIITRNSAAQSLNFNSA